MDSKSSIASGDDNEDDEDEEDDEYDGKHTFSSKRLDAQKVDMVARELDSSLLPGFVTEVCSSS